jgi:hypothetical protein
MIFTNDKKEKKLNIQASIKHYLSHLFEHHIDQSISSVLFACLILY